MEMSRAARTVNVWLKLLRVDDQLLHFKTLELGGYLLAQRALHICVSELSTESVLYIYINTILPLLFPAGQLGNLLLFFHRRYYIIPLFFCLFFIYFSFL
jgi:hypothetical protein